MQIVVVVEDLVQFPGWSAVTVCAEKDVTHFRAKSGLLIVNHRAGPSVSRSEPPLLATQLATDPDLIETVLSTFEWGMEPGEGARAAVETMLILGGDAERPIVVTAEQAMAIRRAAEELNQDTEESETA